MSRASGCALRHLPRSLRGKLTLANVALLAVGLVLATAASLVGMYQVLVGEVDDELRGTRYALIQSSFTTEALHRICELLDGLKPGEGDIAWDALDQNPFVIFGPDGEITPVCRGRAVDEDDERTVLARAVDDPAALADAGEPETVHTGDTVFRVIAARLDDGRVVVAAISLKGIHSAVTKLVVVEALVGASLLGLLAMVSLAESRRRLRPLEDMVATASAIAEGDLSQRVGVGGGSTEVEQLRDALNAMLHQIEGAFETRVRASAQLRQFVADASHELRTPLASIRGYAQLYERGMLDGEEKSRALARISSEGERMNKLVDELLALARLEQGPAPRMTPVDLAQLARDGASDLRAQQPRRPVLVDAGGPVEVMGDEAQLRQVVGNLLANVRTHTPPDAPVTIRVSEHPPGGGAGDTEDGTRDEWQDGAKISARSSGDDTPAHGPQAHLRIADCGPGMRSQDAARIFDRFFRADPDRARVTGGSGLGMSIVQAVVESHGGSVELWTKPGEGLAVTVRLALADGRPGGTACDQARGEASSTTVMSGGAPTRTGGPQKPAPRVT